MPSKKKPPIKVRSRAKRSRKSDDLRTVLSGLNDVLAGFDLNAVGRPEREGELSKPDSKAGKLQRACLELLREHERNGELPTNGRFVFYELEQRGVIPKHYDDLVHQPAHDVTLALIHLRENGLIPWDWLVDESRTLHQWRYSSSVHEYASNAVEHARIDCWDGEEPPLIICESKATAGVLERLAARYLCPITGTGGQCGGFLVTEVAPLLTDNERPVLYLGDLEQGGPGEHIEDNTRRYLEEHADREFIDDDTWKRVALTPAQVQRNGRLRSLALTKIDRRHKPPRRYRAWECEAVGQGPLQRLLQAELDRRLPQPLSEIDKRADRQRKQVRALLAQRGRC
jgi:hypothetical protein